MKPFIFKVVKGDFQKNVKIREINIQIFLTMTILVIFLFLCFLLFIFKTGDIPYT